MCPTTFLSNHVLGANHSYQVPSLHTVLKSKHYQNFKEYFDTKICSFTSLENQVMKDKAELHDRIQLLKN